MLIPEEMNTINRYLDTHRYASVSHWATDNDYHYTYDKTGNWLWVDEDGTPVDIWVCLFHAIEASALRTYEVRLTCNFEALSIDDALEMFVEYLNDTDAARGAEVKDCGPA
jgi:hypothetical protein